MIEDIRAVQVANSCNKKTLKVSLRTEKGVFEAISPAGTSKGSLEAKTIINKRLLSMLPSIRKRFVGRDEEKVDIILEGIGVDRVGSSFSIALSMAAVRARSNNKVYSFFGKHNRFPYPLSNIIGGGVHSGHLTEQEFLVLPVKAKSMRAAADTNTSIWKEIGERLKKSIDGMNKEHAWMCKLSDLKVLDALADTADEYRARIGMDFAANSFYDKRKDRYVYKNPKRVLTPDRQLDFVSGLVKDYKLAYVEDPFHEDDYGRFTMLTKRAKCLVTGDDLFVTNVFRLRMGIEKKACNAIIIKPNQAGTMTRTLKAVKMANKARYTTVVSHRSCETDDTFISDLAVGTGSPVIKIGAHGKDVLKLGRLVKVWKMARSPKMAKLPF